MRTGRSRLALLLVGLLVWNDCLGETGSDPEGHGGQGPSFKTKTVKHQVHRDPKVFLEFDIKFHCSSDPELTGTPSLTGTTKLSKTAFNLTFEARLGNGGVSILNSTKGTRSAQNGTGTEYKYDVKYKGSYDIASNEVGKFSVELYGFVFGYNGEKEKTIRIDVPEFTDSTAWYKCE